MRALIKPKSNQPPSTHKLSPDLDEENIFGAEYFELETSRARRASSITLHGWQLEGALVVAGAAGFLFGHQTKSTQFGAEFGVLGLVIGFGIGAVLKDWIRKKVWRWLSRHEK